MASPMRAWPSSTRKVPRFMAGEPMKPATKAFFGLVVEPERGVDLLQQAVLEDGDAVAHRHASTWSWVT